MLIADTICCFAQIKSPMIVELLCVSSLQSKNELFGENMRMICRQKWFIIVFFLFYQDKPEPPQEGRLPDATKGMYFCRQDCTKFYKEHVTLIWQARLLKLVGFVAGCDHLRDVFVKQMGLTDQDIVALSGGHTLVCLQILFSSCVFLNCALVCSNAFPIQTTFLGKMPQGAFWLRGALDCQPSCL